MGKLYGIGVGSGDPELLTLKAHKILNTADVIFCPEKEEGAGSFALDIIKPVLENEKAEIVSLVYPMHYHGQKLKGMWEQNAECIAEHLKGEKTGAFITLGDPSVYSTFMYTLPYIEAAGVPVQVVPGITSFCAVADKARIPLMTWNEDLVVVPVRKNSRGQLGKIFKEHDNIVLMKPSSDPEALIQAMKENHLENSFVLISRSGTEEEQIITDFEKLEQYQIPYLSTVIIKKQRE